MASVKSRWFAMLAVASVLPAFAADVTFYEHDGFRGRSFTANQSISNFANVGYNDRASSVVVHGGTWQLCSDAYFRGNCVTLTRGQYPNLSSMGLNDAVSSVREMDWSGGGPGTPPGPGGGGGTSVKVELFDGVDFQYQSFAVTGTIRNFADVAYNDHAASMIVYEGTWEACADADFRGMCRTYGPGRYPDLAELKQRISSMRPVAGGGGGGWGGGGVGGMSGGGGWGSGARAILYERPNLSGRSFVIDSEVVANLATTGFNDRASSMRVERGYWIFCTDANFGGECQTFGPGDYPSLPWGMDRRISSGRRIHGQYPYNQQPNWQR